MNQKHLVGSWFFLCLLPLLAFAGQPPEPSRLAQGRQEISQLPAPAQAGISTAIGRDQTAFHARRESGKLRFDNPGHRLKARFTREGAEVEAAGNRFRIQFAGYGRGDRHTSPLSIQPQASANRVEYRRGHLTEWYVNGPLGLEQGFTVEKPPEPARDEPLSIALTISGDLHPRSGKEGLDLVRADGTTALHYGGLAAWDANGHTFPTRWEQKGKKVVLCVEDRGARYPVTVDPFIEQAKLTISDGDKFAKFGSAVAMSGDTFGCDELFAWLSKVQCGLYFSEI